MFIYIYILDNKIIGKEKNGQSRSSYNCDNQNVNTSSHDYHSVVLHISVESWDTNFSVYFVMQPRNSSTIFFFLTFPWQHLLQHHGS